jgi:Protein of unknown function (DUF4038)/Putative collagen-binding domain of a collagenase
MNFLIKSIIIAFLLTCSFNLTNLRAEEGQSKHKIVGKIIYVSPENGGDKNSVTVTTQDVFIQSTNPNKKSFVKKFTLNRSGFLLNNSKFSETDLIKGRIAEVTFKKSGRRRIIDTLSLKSFIKPKTLSAQSALYRAININGPELVIDGEKFEDGRRAEGFFIRGTAFENQSVLLSPRAESNTARMIRSSVWSRNLQLALSVPNDSYSVYLYVWEDNNSQDFSISLEGRVVESRFTSGSEGTWRLLGPWKADVKDGIINITSNGGDANFSGLIVRKDSNNTSPRPTPTPTPTNSPTNVNKSYFKAININGESLNIDGVNWQSSSSVAEFSYEGKPFANQSVSLVPAQEGDLAKMIRSSIYSNSLNLQLRNVPNTKLEVSLYVWEDNFPENFSLFIENQEVSSNIKSGNAGTWQKLGPFITDVNDSKLDISTAGGHANISGIKVVSTTNMTVPTVKPSNTAIPNTIANTPTLATLTPTVSINPTQTPKPTLTPQQTSIPTPSISTPIPTPPNPTPTNPITGGVFNRLRVSENKRFLETVDGKPFFYMADTAWRLFLALDRSEAETYLENRRQRGFNVIQAVALSEISECGKRANAQGDVPFINQNFASPNITLGNNPKSPAEYDYWDHVDYIVNLAASKGMYTALLPAWGEFVNECGGLLNPNNAYTYGKFLANRYKNSPIIWVLGGDRDVSNETHYRTWRGLARGIEEVLGRDALLTYHPRSSSSKDWNNDAWIDFNMWQSGHWAYNGDNYNKIASDYNRLPTRPVIDAEPNYEDHPLQSNSTLWFRDHDARKAAYWAVFAGAAGHTYGHHSIWQFCENAPNCPGFPRSPDRNWQEAILRPGGAQMQHLKRLILSRPYFTRIPDKTLIPTNFSGGRHLEGTRSSDGSYAFIYFPEQSTSDINLSNLSGSTLDYWWYNPRTGESVGGERFNKVGRRTFTTPSVSGPDWVLVIEDASRGFSKP